MIEAIRNALRAAARPLVFKAGRRPAGIWLAWLALAYAALALRHRLFMLVSDPIGKAQALADAIVIWPVIVAAIIAMAMRRRISQLFGGIVFSNLLIHTIYNADWFGAAVAILGFIGLLVNRRWFFDKLPNVE